MNKGKIYQHLHGLGLNGEQSMRVLQLIGAELITDVTVRVNMHRRLGPTVKAYVLSELGELNQELGLNFDEQQTERR